MDGLVGVILKGWVGQIGEDVRLVDQGSLKLVGRAGVEHGSRQVGSVTPSTSRLAPTSSLWGDPRVGMTYLAAMRSGNFNAIGAGAGGIARAHGDESAVGVLTGQIGHP